MIIGKVLMQDIWRIGITWNDLIVDNIYKSFKKWIGQLDMVKHFQISRCYSQKFLDSSIIKELHIFVDASEQAFAALATILKFPLLSVPRLELQAAVLGMRLRNLILESHDIAIKRFVRFKDSARLDLF